MTSSKVALVYDQVIQVVFEKVAENAFKPSFTLATGPADVKVYHFLIYFLKYIII